MQKNENNETRSPLGDHVRSVYYDQQGEPYFTEWQPFGPTEYPPGIQPPEGIALVTGIRPGGCGEAITWELALNRRFRVFACDREPELGSQAVKKIRGNGGDVIFLQADLTREEDVVRVIDEIVRSAGRLDVLVNNGGHAGKPARDNILQLTAEEFRALVDDNLTAPFLVSQAALRRLMLPQRSGIIVFIGTLSTEWGVWGQVGYHAGKAGLQAVCNHIIALCSRHNIRAHLVRPGIIETQSKNAEERRRRDPRYYEKEGCISPRGRVGQPSDVANAISWLIDSKAAYIGAEVLVDGGLKQSGLMHPAWDPLDFRPSYVASVTLYEQATRREAA